MTGIYGFAALLNWIGFALDRADPSWWQVVAASAFTVVTALALVTALTRRREEQQRDVGPDRVTN